MITERDHIDAVGPDLVKQITGDAASAGDVLGVGDDEIDFLLTDDLWELLMNDLSAGSTDDVPQNQNAQWHGG